MADEPVLDRDNWAVFSSREKALAHAMATWGQTKGSILWHHGNEFWINDGIDPETGQPFPVPEGAVRLRR